MEILELTALELGKKIKAGEITVKEAVQAVIDRAKEVEPVINSYVTLDEAGAFAQAEEIQKKIDAGELTGPLAGVPVAIKDNMCIKEQLTTCSSKILSNFKPTYTAEAVENLKKLLSAPLPEFPVSATVACQGIYGANSGAAAEKLFPISDITYFRNFEGVFSAVEKGLCEFGVLPIENSKAGSVLDVYDLMKKYRFNIVKSVRLRIDHCLAAVKGATVKDIKTVISHPQALSQCADYLKKSGVKTEASENTAIAAKTVADNGDKSVGVICTLQGAEAYGLNVLERGIQDSDSNYTRFICISKDLRIYKGADKISIMTGLEHKPGSLNRILSSFYALGLNLTKIESRPTAGFEFTFYFDFDGDVSEQGVLNLIADLENGSDKFVFLGSYKEIV